MAILLIFVCMFPELFYAADDTFARATLLCPDNQCPNPFRRIEENSYDIQVPPADEGRNTTEGVYMKRKVGTRSFESAEILIPNTRGISQPTSSREPSRGGPSSGDATIISRVIEGDSSTETLRPHLNDPMLNRMPARTSTSPLSSGAFICLLILERGIFMWQS